MFHFIINFMVMKNNSFHSFHDFCCIGYFLFIFTKCFINLKINYFRFTVIFDNLITFLLSSLKTF